MKRVLLVDDDESILASFGRALRREGFEVVEAKSSAVALDRLSGGEAAPFHLAVVDLFLGGQTSGFQVARRVSELHPDAGILIVSGFLGSDPPRHGIPASRLEFLQKPVAPGELVRVARRLAA